MQQPSDVSRQLGGFGTRQKHAVIQSVQEAVVLNPFAPFHQFGMHDRNLPCRPAKTDKPELEPKTKGFAKRWRAMSGGRCFRFFLLRTRRHGHNLAWASFIATSFGRSFLASSPSR